MIKAIVLLALISTASAADISTYVPDGDMQILGTGNDLSGLAYIDYNGGGEAYVDNKTGRVNFPGGSCYLGGDLESVAQMDASRLYVVNEAKNGVNVLKMSNCAVERKFLTDIPVASDGIEGIFAHNGLVYILEESTGTVSYFIDGGGTAKAITTQVFSANESGAGDLTIGDNGNFLIVFDGSKTAKEFTSTSDLVSVLAIPEFLNPEGVYWRNDKACFAGEPNNYRCYVGSSTPRTTEICSFSGEVEVYHDTSTIKASQIVQLTCPTIINASGIIQ